MKKTLIGLLIMMGAMGTSLGGPIIGLIDRATGAEVPDADARYVFFITNSVVVVSNLTIIGGIKTNSILTLQSTMAISTGALTAATGIVFAVGSNGETKAMVLLNNGSVGIMAVPTVEYPLNVGGTINATEIRSPTFTVAGLQTVINSLGYGNFVRLSVGYNGTNAPENGAIIQGDVGLNTNLPAAKLHVNGSTLLGGAVQVFGVQTNLGNMYLSGGDFFAGTNKIVGGSATNSILTLQSTTGISTGALTGAIGVQVAVGSNGNTKAITVLNNGFVAVGTNVALSRFDIVSTDPDANIARFVNRSATGYGPSFQAGTGSRYIADFSDYLGGAAMRVLQTGVGIKTNNPAAALHVGGDLLVTGAVNLATSGGIVGIGTTTNDAGRSFDVRYPTQWSQFKSSTETQYSLFDVANSSNIMRIGIERLAGGGTVVGSSPFAGVIGTTANFPVQIFQNGAIFATIKNNALGLMTNTPAATLHVNGDLLVTGGMVTTGGVAVAASSGGLAIGTGLAAVELDVRGGRSKEYLPSSAAAASPWSNNTGTTVNVQSTNNLDNSAAMLGLSSKTTGGQTTISYIGNVSGTGSGTVITNAAQVFGLRVKGATPTYKEIMRLTSEERMGLMTNLPAATLHVGGDLLVTGAVNLATGVGNVNIGTNVASDNSYLSVYPNVPGTATLYKVRIGSPIGLSAYAGFGHVDRFNNTDYAFIQGADGSSYFNTTAGGLGMGFAVGGARKMIMDVNGNFGIGTNFPAVKLHVATLANGGPAMIFGGTTSNGNVGALSTYNGISADEVMVLVGANAAISNSGAYYRYSQYMPGMFMRMFNRAGSESIQFNRISTAGIITNVLHMDMVSGNIGIGTNVPAAKLHIDGSVLVQGGNIVITNADAAAMLTVAGGGVSPGITVKSISGGTRGSLLAYNLDYAVFNSFDDGDGGYRPWLFNGNVHEFYSATNAARTSLVLTMCITNGNIGIGTTAPLVKFHLNGPQVSAAVPFNQLTYDTTNMAAGVGAGIGFGGNYITGVGTPATFGGIRAGKENGNTSDTAGYLSLFSRPNGGGVAEVIRITSTGNVGIGTNIPGAALQVRGAIISDTNYLYYVNATSWVGVTANINGRYWIRNSNGVITVDTDTWTP